MIVVIARTVGCDEGSGGTGHAPDAAHDGAEDWDTATGAFYVLTDVHLDTQYDLTCSHKTYCRAPCNVSDSTWPFNPALGQYGCDTPLGLLASAVGALQEVEEKQTLLRASFVVVCGDSAGHDLPSSNETLDSIREAADVINDELPAHLKQRVLPVLGNNDLPGDYCLSVGPNSWLQEMSEVWQPWLAAWPGAAATFREGGYFSASVSSALRVLSVNTVWYSPKYRSTNCYHEEVAGVVGDTDGPGEVQLRWLAQELDAARAAGQKVVIAGHIPPVIDDYKYVLAWTPSAVQALADLASANADVLVGGLFSHFHSDQLRLVGDTLPVLLSPAVSPVYNNNPGFRRYFVGEEQPLLDYEQYYVELWDEGRVATPNSLAWVPEYTFRKAYNVSSLSGPNIKTVIEQLASDRELYSVYKLRRSVQVDTAHRAYSCAMTAGTEQDWSTCVGRLLP